MKGFAMRIGHGYDVHRYDETRPLILGGVHVPSFAGLAGHSDADVLLHAIMDALLGAAGLRDIGYYFPPTDNTFLNADSAVLAREVLRLVREKGYRIVNIDSTVIAQKPKLSPYIDAIKARLAEIFEISADGVNVKATTEEGLGFTGELRGMSAHAVCLIESI